MEYIRIEDFKNIEIAQLKALAKVFRNEDVLSEQDRLDLCYLMKDKIDQIWDRLESALQGHAPWVGYIGDHG